MLDSWFAIALSALLAADAGAEGGGGNGNAAGGNRVERSALPQPPSLLSPIGPHRVVPEGLDLDTLKEAKDGSGDRLYQGNGFSARVAPDGSVSFSDKNLTGLSPIPFWPMNAQMGVPSLQSSMVSLLKGRRPPKAGPSELDQGLPPPETKQVNPDVSRYRPDPRENCRECAFNSLAVPLNGLARFDVADQLERFSGKDPFRYQKAVFLAATHEQRVQMAARTHARQLRQASADLPARLQGIACNDRLTYRERRAIIAALAAELDTTTPDGAAAQKSIRSFLTHFDAGDVACTAAAPAP